ncbi:MAG: iron ABC transporter permease [Cyclobacteriaceae bacterium]|nr:iron ABC transporter permease [Cyclobacteriaceae bacterium]
MSQKTNYTSFLFLILLMLAIFTLFAADIMLGSVKIPPREIWNVLIGNSSNVAWENIIFKIRLPKAITAILAGGALAVCGLQMQTLFRNPLAGPSVLGITAGASLGVAIVFLGSGLSTSIYALRELGINGSWLVFIASTAGSAFVLGLVLMLSFRINDNVILLLVGIMVGNITLSLVSIWQYYSHPDQIQDYVLWTMGSLNGVDRNALKVLGIVVISALVLSVGISKMLNILLLGENYARSLGLNVRYARIIIILSSSILTGSVTGFCGPIGFVGLAVPHLARAILKTADHRWLTPASFLTGAAIMLLCDIIAQMPGTASTLPINAITALIGSPVVIWVILKRGNLKF